MSPTGKIEFSITTQKAGEEQRHLRQKKKSKNEASNGLRGKGENLGQRHYTPPLRGSQKKREGKRGPKEGGSVDFRWFER